jgi:formimidoylglutamase
VPGRSGSRNIPDRVGGKQLQNRTGRNTLHDVNADPLADLRGAPDPRDPRASSLLRDRPPGGDPGAWSLLGLPYDGGIPSRPGARFGPSALRRALAGFGTFDGERELPPVHDLGDLSLPSMEGADAHRRIEEAARRLFSEGRRTAFVGGDHGCTGSILRGLAAARPELRLAVISVDAHLDVREYADERSLSSGTPFRRALETGIAAGERTAAIGLRPFANSRHYMEWARGRGIHLFTAEDVGERGAEAVAESALEAAAADADALYLSIDIDAVDAAFAPGVSAPGIGGLTAREALALVHVVARDPRLVAFDVMELSPPHDADERTARLAARLLLEALRAAE